MIEDGTRIEFRDGTVGPFEPAGAQSLNRAWLVYDLVMRLPGRSSVKAGVGVAVGVFVGAVLARWGVFFDWVRDTFDWQSLPATVIGTTVPAAAGVLYAQRLTERSAATMYRTQLQIEEERSRDADEREAGSRALRRELWAELDGVLRPLLQRLVRESLCRVNGRRPVLNDETATRRGEMETRLPGGFQSLGLGLRPGTWCRSSCVPRSCWSGSGCCG